MNTLQHKKLDWVGGVVFAALTVAFILLAIFNSTFFDWIWNRHHNILSWYIRPVAMLPFIFFAYKRSFTGMMFSIFAIATSMAWFPEPEVVEPEVAEFLAVEIKYLTSSWDMPKIIVSLMVPLLIGLMGYAFWKRNLLSGGLVVIASMIGKMIWSVFEAGESGWAILLPAVVGLLLTLGLIYGWSRWQSSVQKAI